MLNGKKIILGVTGSIAAYKAAHLTRLLITSGATVKVIMTNAAKKFIAPITLSTLSKNPVYTKFTKNTLGEWHNHVELGGWADAIVIAPASANTLAKMAHGQCDNILLAVYLSATCPIWVAPAMDLGMWQHPATQQNIKNLKQHSILCIDPQCGELASGIVGMGRMAEPKEIICRLEKSFKEIKKKRLNNKRVLVTAGPTYEAIDPVRFIGNNASGKMGFAIAEALAREGAKVVLVSGPTLCTTSHPDIELQQVTSAQDMLKACKAIFPQSDIAVFSASVADYQPAIKANHKIKKQDKRITLNMIQTPDIVATLGKVKKEKQLMIGFALETQNEEINAKKKMKEKNLDFIVLNSLNDEGAGFGHDTNKISIIDKNEKIIRFNLKSKKEVAEDIVEFIVREYV